MNMIWSKKADAILGVGRCLEDVGVCNWALTREQALIALDQFKVEGIAILGGDVFEMRNRVLQSNYDNWHCDRKQGESTLAFVSRSVAKTKEYVVNYKLDCDTQYFFIIVPEC